jgi:WhiB family redox-sensing transcriptional regulator
MAEPRTLKDPAATLAEFTALMNSSTHATLPCAGGDEWWSEDPRLQARAATLCRACDLQPVCRSYALAAGEKAGVWGGTTPLDRKRLRRKAAA